MTFASQCHQSMTLVYSKTIFYSTTQNPFLDQRLTSQPGLNKGSRLKSRPVTEVDSPRRRKHCKHCILIIGYIQPPLSFCYQKKNDNNDQPCNRQQCHQGTLQTVQFLDGHDKNHRHSHHLSERVVIFPPILQVLHQHLEHGTDYAQSGKVTKSLDQHRQWNMRPIAKIIVLFFSQTCSKEEFGMSIR